MDYRKHFRKKKPSRWRHLYAGIDQIKSGILNRKGQELDKLVKKISGTKKSIARKQKSITRKEEVIASKQTRLDELKELLRVGELEYETMVKTVTNKISRARESRNREPKLREIPESKIPQFSHVENELKERTDLLEKSVQEKGFTVERKGNRLTVKKGRHSQSYQFSQKTIELQFFEQGTNGLADNRDGAVWGYAKRIDEDFQEMQVVDKEREQKIQSLRDRPSQENELEISPG